MRQANQSNPNLKLAFDYQVWAWQKMDMQSRKPSASSKNARGTRDNGAATRKLLLEAAGIIFAQKGFDRATAKEIADAAGTNAASVNYHFGGIERLYEAVLVHAHDELISLRQLQDMTADDLPAQEKLRRLMAMVVALFTGPDTSSWAIRVISREFLSPSPYLVVLREKALDPKKSLILDIVAELADLPKDDPAVMRCFFNIAAPCGMLLMVNREMFRQVLPSLEKSDPATLERHLVQFALGGISAVVASR